TNMAVESGYPAGRAVADALGATATVTSERTPAAARADGGAAVNRAALESYPGRSRTPSWSRTSNTTSG
ncbi:MAG: hypothetical protein ACI8TL_002131, partial [Natronomonas sp.]